MYTLCEVTIIYYWGMRKVDFWPPAKEIARLCGVDLATARRWRRQASCPPASAVFLINADLGCFDKAWRGWIMRRGLLVSPDGQEVAPNDIRAIPFMRLQIHSYQLESRLQHMASFEEQPTPESWEVRIEYDYG